MTQEKQEQDILEMRECIEQIEGENLRVTELLFGIDKELYDQ